MTVIGTFFRVGLVTSFFFPRFVLLVPADCVTMLLIEGAVGFVLAAWDE